MMDWFKCSDFRAPEEVVLLCFIDPIMETAKCFYNPEQPDDWFNSSGIRIFPDFWAYLPEPPDFLTKIGQNLGREKMFTDDSISKFSSDLAKAIREMNHNIDMIKTFMAAQNIQNECFMDSQMEMRRRILELEALK